MMIFSRSILCIAILLGAIGCAVIPAEISQNALNDMPLAELIRDAGRFRGETVVVGGYVVEVTNLEDQSRIIAVQAPLGIAQEPRAKDLSQGRLVIRLQGFIDPEVYKKERKITVAGIVTGSSQTEQGQYPYPYLRIDLSHIHLWPEEKAVPYDPYWDPWMPTYRYYPYGWRHPYWW
jgi:outer membrane lipoprotein